MLTQELQGIPVPFVLSRGITKRLDERGYGILGSDSAIDETAASHEAVLELAVRRVELETALRILLAEIRRTNVRVNALRQRLIPDLEARKEYVEFYLAEREREARLAQRFFKRKCEAKRDDRRSSRERNDGADSER